MISIGEDSSGCSGEAGFAKGKGEASRRCPGQRGFCSKLRQCQWEWKRQGLEGTSGGGNESSRWFNHTWEGVDGRGGEVVGSVRKGGVKQSGVKVAGMGTLGQWR